MSTATSVPQRLTAEEFLARHLGDHVELVNGIVEGLPMPGLEHGVICLEIARRLKHHVAQHDLGRVAINDSFVQTGSDTIRGADVLFYSYERLPKELALPKGPHTHAPDLVVEVRSPTDRWTAIIRKAMEYLDAGVPVVVLLDPPTATASVYRPDELHQILHNSDPLTLPDVLPGFSVPVSSLFG